MTIHNRPARLAYENAPDELKEATDFAFAGLAQNIKDSEFSGRFLQCANDDSAENLVTEIFLFICKSNGIAWEGFAYEKGESHDL